MKQVVVYPGRFQPMLPHHAAVFSNLQTSFPNAEIYIATSDKVDHPKSPFNFEEKKHIMTELYNIPENRIVLVRRPYNGDDYAQHFDADNTQLILIVGDKDMQQDARFSFNNVDPDTGIDMKLNGSGPKWMQMINSIKDGDVSPFSTRGYLATAPTVERNGEVASASAFRNAFVQAVDAEHRKEVMRNYLGQFNQGIFNLLQNKILDKNMSEDINRLKHLAGLDEAPVNFDDYQPISPKDAKSAAERPGKAAASDPSKAQFFPADPDMFHSTIAKSVANRMAADEDPNDPTVKKEHFMMELLKAPALLLGEINARLKNDDNGLAVSDRLSAVISKVDEVGSVMNLPEDDRRFVIQIVTNALKNMDLVKDPKADKEREEYEKENESVDLSAIKSDYGIEEAGTKTINGCTVYSDGSPLSFSDWKSEVERETGRPMKRPAEDQKMDYQSYVNRCNEDAVRATESKGPYTNSNHSQNKIKKPYGADAHTKPEGGNPQVCHLCKGEGCDACGDTGEEISPKRNDPDGRLQNMKEYEQDTIDSMIKCPSCDEDHSSKEKTCPHCGAQNNVAEGTIKDQAQEDFETLADMKASGASEEELEDKASRLIFGMDVLHAVLNDWESPFADPDEPDMEESIDTTVENAINSALEEMKKLAGLPNESFDHDAEQSREEEAYNELMDAYGQGGEEAYAEACGLSMEELDQEMGEISRDLNLHMDDDRDEILQRHAEDTVDNADWKDHGEPEVDEDIQRMRDLAGF